MSVNYNLEDCNEKNIIAGKYEVLSILGRGRNSVVYRAKTISHNNNNNKNEENYFALKVLPLTEKKFKTQQNRMKREALAMLSAKHHNVIKLYDFISNNENCILVMEYADSGDLFQLLEKANSPLELDFVIDIIIQTLNGLEHLHRKGIIHRDLKPENLLLSAKHIIKIADFSVADIPKSEFKKDKDEYCQTVGTIDYIAPECLNNGSASVQSDIYALGITFYQLLTNKLPFEADSFSEHLNLKFSTKYQAASELNSKIPIQIDQIIAKAIVTDTRERYKNSREFIDALETYRKIAKKIDYFTLDKFKLNSDFGNKDLLLEEDEAKSEEVIEEIILKKEKGNKRGLYRLMAATSVCFLIIAATSFAYIEFNRRNSLAKENTEVREEILSENEQRIEDEILVTGANDSEPLPENSSVFSLLATEKRKGVFKKLHYDGSDVNFISEPVENENNRVFFHLSLARWEPVEVNLQDLIKNRKTELSYGGIKLELDFEKAKVLTDNSVIANYTDLLSGKTGELIFK